MSQGSLWECVYNLCCTNLLRRLSSSTIGNELKKKKSYYQNLKLNVVLFSAAIINCYFLKRQHVNYIVVHTFSVTSRVN